MESIQLEDDADRWAWTCPAGHRTWEPTNHHFWCRSCAASPEAKLEPEFEELRNARTGDLVHRDDLVLITASGPVRDSTATGM